MTYNGNYRTCWPALCKAVFGLSPVPFEEKFWLSWCSLAGPAQLRQALNLGLRQLVDHHLDLGDAPGRANAGDKMMTLIASALAGGDCIDDADALRAGGTAGVLDCTVKASTLGSFRGPRPPAGPGEPRVAGPCLVKLMVESFWELYTR